MYDCVPCILMATYNGARYIEEQLDSLIGQTHEAWLLLVSDDGSSDATADLLRERAAREERLCLLPPRQSTATGPTANFSRLITEGLRTDCNLFFLCDQDDIWEQDKLATLLRQFPEAGREAGPLLVHSDLSVMNADSEPLFASMAQYADSDPLPGDPLTQLLSRNFVTGCAVACNRRLLEAASPIPERAIMHDWWLALVAAAAGSIKYEPRPMVRYRQHSDNTVGARRIGDRVAAVTAWPRMWREGNREFVATFDQAIALLELAQKAGDWPEDACRRIRRYAELPEVSLGARIANARSLGIRVDNTLLRWIFFLRLLTHPGDFIHRTA